MITASQLGISVLTALWVYFFIYSSRYKSPFPWGFGIVIMGLALVGREYAYLDKNTISFSINLMFVVCLVGIHWNINNIKEQFYIRNSSKLLCFIRISLIAGLLLGLAMQILSRVNQNQSNGQYTTFALVMATLQISVAEEILFRGYLLGYLKRYEFNPLLAITGQSLFFAFLHIPDYLGDWMALLNVFLTGGISGYLVWKSNNLIPSFLLHIVINLIAVTWWLSTSP